MTVSLHSFGWTLGIGLPVLAVVVSLTRRPQGRSGFSRIGIAFLVALMITPTIWSPFDKTYAEAAAVVLFCGVAGLTPRVLSFLIGGLPIIFTTALICGVWQLSKRRST
jgi:hypothetical protein